MRRPRRWPVILAALVLARSAAAAPAPDQSAPATPTSDQSAPATPTPNQEVVPPTEHADTALLVDLIEAGISAFFLKGNRPAHRDAHAKGHGCVKGDFAVDDNIPADLRSGVFAQPKTWKAWIRFSNSSNNVRPDFEGDGRGMAIKLLGVPGRKVLPDEADDQTQDFLMINLPTFFIKNVAEYIEFTSSFITGKQEAFFTSHPPDGDIFKAMNSPANMEMAQTFYSMAPYILGDKYIKFAARPYDCATGAMIPEVREPGPKDQPNYLRQGMVDWLHEKDACFDFAVQPQTNPKTQPIENPTVEWKPSEAPFVSVAKIRIPKQTFDTPAQQNFCENLSYTPWHTLPEERPVGGINRMRRAVYEAISKLRHKLNDAPRQEPTGNENFN